MSNKNIPPQQFTKFLSTIHKALVIGLVLFIGVSLFVQMGKEATPPSKQVNIYFILVGALGLASIFLSDYLIHKQVKKAKNELGLESKLNKYLQAKIIKYALLEAPTLLSTIFYLYTGRPGFIVIAICILLMMIAHYPSFDKTVTELDLSVAEQEQLKMS